MTDVIVIGGGAAGMMAAYAAGMSGGSVLLIEKNEKLGKKIYITGKGRCNVTNACDFEGLIRNQCRNGKFLYSSFRRFSNEDLCSLLESAGCRLKTERGDRVFPVSDHASDVTKALTALLQEAGARVRLRTEVRGIVKLSDGSFSVRIFDIIKKRVEQLSCRKVIVATGGLSYPTTGSTGDGYRFAESFDIHVTDRLPSLVPILLDEQEECSGLSGLSLKNVGLSLFLCDRLIYEDQGELLFTHTGISGPLVLTASSYAGEALCEGGEFTEMYVSIDMKPALSLEKLDERLLRDFDQARNQDIKNILRSLLPISLILPVLGRAGLAPDKKANSITREERRKLSAVVKDLRYSVKGLGGFNEAVITKGGVDVKEIDPRTREAKKAEGLYFAGEVLDIDSRTGGFNLQNAFSTGYAAGTAAGQ